METPDAVNEQHMACSITMYFTAVRLKEIICNRIDPDTTTTVHFALAKSGGRKAITSPMSAAFLPLRRCCR